MAGAALAEAPAASRPDMRVSIRQRGTAGDEDGLIRGVQLEGEAASEAAARAYGFRSMRSVIDVDCLRGRERVVRMEAFEEHAQRGTSSSKPLTGQWAAPSPDAYLAEVVSAVCRGRPVREPPRLQAANTAPPPVPQPAIASQAPATAPRLRQAPAARPPDARPATALARNDPPKPAPSTPAPPPAPVKTAQLLRAPSIAALAIVSGPIQPARPAAPTAGSWAAQVAATSSPQAARQALDAVAGLIGKGQATRVEPATVGGRQVYRATVAGFGSRGDAAAFCARLERGGKECWAR